MRRMDFKSRLRSRIPLLILFFIMLSGYGHSLVPPHPKYKNPPDIKSSRPSEIFRRIPGKPQRLPNNVLVLRVQFSDVQFQAQAVYPDSLVHDWAFFDRWMVHLSDFFYDASHGQYILNYYLPGFVITLPNTMAYYGSDTSDKYDARVEQMVQEAIWAADPDVNYSQYDAVIMFHAGAGQESDIERIRPQQIWSTFVTRKDLREAFEPDNPNYQGIQTADNRIISEVVLLAESEFQDYFPPPSSDDAALYIFSIFGVLAHQFGHQLGLPTLFDNYSANGRSQGIGNWGLMGTGLWNGNGFVPAQLCGWSRYYLGWEDAGVVDFDVVDLTVEYFLNHNSAIPRLYKIPVSEHEYFLIENRQQNPDTSIDPYTSQDSFTFRLLPQGEQDYYPEPYSLRPYFNFMENRYIGCEWDFFMPGLGGPLLPGQTHPVNGSGLLIWHIDENVINEYFSSDFEINIPNGNAMHKGVDVEEADGIQHLDTAVFDYYKYGSPYDTYRQGNNVYLGNQSYEGFLHLPTAASYYGGVSLEIYDISAAGNQMTFSVRFGWKLDTQYSGINTLDACAVDVDSDGEKEIFYPMPDGQLYVWKNEELMNGYPLVTGSINQLYCWDGDAFYLPVQFGNVTQPIRSLKKLQNGQITTLQTTPAQIWAAPLVNLGDYLALPYHSISNQQFNGSGIKIVNKQNLLDSYDLDVPDSLCTNLAWYHGKLYALSHSQSAGYRLSVYDSQYWAKEDTYNLQIAKDSVVVSLLIAKLTPGNAGDVLLQTPYCLYLTGLTGEMRNGYPRQLPFFSNVPAVISDVDRNGILDIVISGENTFSVYDFAGYPLFENFRGLSPADMTGIIGGVLPGNFDYDSKIEFIGNFSRNRLCAWDDNLRMISDFPKSNAQGSRHMPFVHKASDNQVYAWSATDNGMIFRAPLPQASLPGIDQKWYCRYANLGRTASREDTDLPNVFETTKLFVPNEVFVFPNPLSPVYEQKLTFQIMTSRDAEVEVSVFDIAGKKIFRKNVLCKAWLRNKELVDFPVDRLASGVYIAVLKSGSEVKRIKFALEK